MGKIILVDKPKGMTSFDVCFKMRKIFGTKKIGHTGTLDPNATGLMMVLIDSAAKIDQFINLMVPLGLVEVSRTGVAAISRGPEKM